MPTPRPREQKRHKAPAFCAPLFLLLFILGSTRSLDMAGVNSISAPVETVAK